MPTVGAAIMAHPRRAVMARDLSITTGAPVVWDTDDTEWHTGRRAWLEGADSGTTHWMVVQDDALVSRHLIPAVEAALGYVNPPSPLSLYLGRARPFADFVQSLVNQTTTETSFITTYRINWGVGLVIPTVQIPAMIDYCDKRSDVMYDRRLSKWFQFNKTSIWHTWPSLVDHRNGPSLNNHNSIEDRTAHNFLGTDKSALDLDWSGNVVSVRESGRKP